MILRALNPLDELVLEGTSSNAVCSGLPHFSDFGGHLIESVEHAPHRLAVGLLGGNIRFKYSLVMFFSSFHFSLHIKYGPCIIKICIL